ncbi:hypothetical protein MMC24_002486 [Lignoscripta atroalba]|nr:hypothetical protein [Lignoscripta atroalba]
MVTAILPSMTAASPPAQTVTPQINPGHTHDRTMSPSVSSELTITPARLQSQQPRSSLSPGKPFEGSSPTRLAGLVGLFTGCGALLALGVFLRLPAQFQDLGIEPGQALADTYYLVGGLALLVGSTCFIGLRRLNGEEEKGWHAVVQREKVKDGSSGGRRSLAYWKLLVRSISLGLNNPLIGLGYLGGFVARASSVGISLFIPLFVNAYFTSHGLCKINTVAGPRDMKSQCPKAYTVAAELTGVSELVALLSAPLIGFLADKYRRFHLPLLVANVAGIAGYVGFATLGGPAPSEEHGNPWIFIIVALIGIGQMGTIVCSLGLLGRGILGLEKGTTGLESTVSNCSNGTGQNGSEPSTANGYRSISDHPEESMHDSPASRLVQGQSWDQADENTGLLPIGTREDHSLIHLKGSIAGVYSLAGGAGILLLTKLGGYLFDAASSSAPFYMLATFNALLLVVAVVCGIREAVTGRSQHEEIEA